MRPLHLLCALLAQGLALSPAVAAENEDARSGLERLELALAQAVDRVSRPAAAPLLAAGSCRGYRIRGVGAVFVLPPRALRQGGSVFVFHPGEAPPAPEGTPSAETPRPRRASRGKARVADPREEQMRLIEAQVEAFQREAERSRQEAEAALDQLEYQVRLRLGPAQRGGVPVAPPPSAPLAAPAPAPPSPAMPATPAVPAVAPLPPPPAPWRYWFETADEADDARPATQIVADVRAAMTDALEAQGATLASVGPDELLVTAVDFVSGPALIPAGRPDKTIVLRVRRKDLEDRRSGKISPEELRKRIDYAEY